MDLSTIFWVLLVIGVLFGVLSVVSDSPGIFLLGLVFFAVGVLGNVLLSVNEEENKRTICNDNSVYKKGSHVKITGMSNTAIVVRVTCNDVEKQLREYEVVTNEEVFLEVKEENLMQ